jgi:hypothetical protein
MNTRACPQCKSANLASAVLCVTCGARLAGPPPAPAPPADVTPLPPAVTGPPIPAMPSMPPGATVQYWGERGSAPPPARRRSVLVPVLALIAVVVIAVGVVSTLHRGGSLPGEIDGLERMHTADASTFEDTMAAQRYGDIGMEGGMYGDGSRTVLVVGLVSNIPQSELQAPLDFVFDQGAQGFARSSGGTIDSSGAESVTVAGVQYRCASFELPGPVSGGGGHGSLCMWQADDLGFLITFRTSDPSAAFGDIRTVYDAIHGG